ncbi:MAG: hypothetical protein ACTHNW_05455 [Mucilaginibacter sp.]
MKKQLLTLFSLLISATFSYAQEVKHAQPDSVIKIIPLEGRHDGYLYTIGGKLYTRQEVTNKLLSYKSSATELLIGKRELTWGYVSFAGSGLAAGGALLAFAHDNKLNGSYSYITGSGANSFIQTYYPHHNKTAAYVFTGVSAALLTTGIIEIINGSKHVNKSLSLFNMRFE